MWLSDCIDLVLLDRPRRRTCRLNRRKPLRLLVLPPGSFFSEDEDRDDNDSSAAGLSPSSCPLMPAVSAPAKLISLPARLLCQSTVHGCMRHAICVGWAVRGAVDGAVAVKNSWSAGSLA